MISWKNLDELKSYQALCAEPRKVNLREAMQGENGAERVRKYAVPMAEGLSYHYAAKAVDDGTLNALKALAQEAQLTEKYQALYEGEVINTGEKRLVLHQLTRGQLGKDVVADNINKREFYVREQEKAAAFARDVHSGKITNAQGEKFTTAVQIGIGGSDLGPRAMYLALENWAKKNGTDGMGAALLNMLRALFTFAIMIGVAVGLDHVSGSFVRSANLVVLVAYSCAAGILLFVLTLIIQRYLGSKDAKDILNELLGKVLRKLHLA